MSTKWMKVLESKDLEDFCWNKRTLRSPSRSIEIFSFNVPLSTAEKKPLNTQVEALIGAHSKGNDLLPRGRDNSRKYRASSALLSDSEIAMCKLMVISSMQFPRNDSQTPSWWFVFPSGMGPVLWGMYIVGP